MKKIITLILVACMLFTTLVPVAFAEESKDISISFKVGDSTLSINGKDVTVETPYVVDGVTLVPIRVITEAFGAELNWISETQEIELSYLDVIIKLQIDNINVYVNGQKQELLYAPQLTNSVTMVPLRFITENFGADVKYDEATKAISIVKTFENEQPVSEISDILKKSDKDFVGDSYYKWSMKRTPDMSLSYRSFDGRGTEFSFEDDVTIYYDIYRNTSEDTIETARVKELESVKNYTLISNKIMKTPSGTQYVHVQSKSKERFYDSRIYIFDDKVCYLLIIADVSLSQSVLDKYIEISDSFDFAFKSAEAQDLSEVENGMRLFSEKDLNIEFRMPADWYDFSSDNKVNNFQFEGFDKDNVVLGMVHLIVYSEEEGDTLTDWVTRDHTRNKKQINPNIYTISDIESMKVGNETAMYYSTELERDGQKYTARDIFWELGKYRYNINIEVKKSNEAMIQKILDTVKYEEIDFDKVGILLQEKLTEDEDSVVSLIKNTSLKFEVNIPTSWGSNSDKTSFYDSRKGIGVIFGRSDEMPTVSQINERASELAKTDGTKVVKKAASVPKSELNSNSYSAYSFEISVYEDKTTNYLIQYVINADKNVYILTFIIPEMFYSDATRETISKIVKSFKAS